MISILTTKWKSKHQVDCGTRHERTGYCTVRTYCTYRHAARVTKHHISLVWTLLEQPWYKPRISTDRRLPRSALTNTIVWLSVYTVKLIVPTAERYMGRYVITKKTHSTVSHIFINVSLVFRVLYINTDLNEWRLDQRCLGTHAVIRKTKQLMSETEVKS